MPGPREPSGSGTREPQLRANFGAAFWGATQMMTRDVLLEMEQEEDDDEDGDIGE